MRTNSSLGWSSHLSRMIINQSLTKIKNKNLQISGYVVRLFFSRLLFLFSGADISAILNSSVMRDTTAEESTIFLVLQHCCYITECNRWMMVGISSYFPTNLAYPHKSDNVYNTTLPTLASLLTLAIYIYLKIC